MQIPETFTRSRFELALKQEKLPPGFYVVSGVQGAGKSSLITAWLSLDFKYHSKERLRLAQARIRALNASGYNLKVPEKPEHLYYTSTDMTLQKTLSSEKAIHTNKVDVKRFGLPNKKYKVQYFEFGSVIYITEADVLYYTQDWQKISNYVWQLLKFVRHNQLTVIFDLQAFDRLSIQLRKLCTDLIFVKDSRYTPSRFFGLIKQQTHWNYYWAKPQEQDAIAAFESTGIKLSHKTVFKGGFNYKGDIYKQYDSYYGEMYFLYGIEDSGYTVLEHAKRSYTPEGVAAFCEDMPLEFMDEEAA